MPSPWTSGNGLDIRRTCNTTTVPGKMARLISRDLILTDCFSPGDSFSKAVGSVYANASVTLLNQGPEKAGTMYFNL